MAVPATLTQRRPRKRGPKPRGLDDALNLAISPRLRAALEKFADRDWAGNISEAVRNTLEEKLRATGDFK